MREKQGRHFGVISILNHWCSAIVFLSLLALGFFLEFTGDGRGTGGPLMGLHKSVGVLFLGFACWRLGWRLLQGFPKDVASMPWIQEVAAKLVHWALLTATIVMPVSGILMSIYGNRSINVFGLFTVPAMPENEYINRIADGVHWAVAYLVALAVLMHVGGVLKHHLLDRDETLKRMIKPLKSASQPEKPS